MHWVDRDIRDPVDAGGTTTTLGTGGNETDTLWIGGCMARSDRYWALIINDTSTYEFHVSNDGVNWTHQYTFAGTVQYVLDWHYNANSFYATQNGTTAPLLISNDRGETWQAQTGSWEALGYNVTIPCCAVN